MLRDAIDDFRLSLDVASEGMAERLRMPAPYRRVAVGFLSGLGWTMIIPQGIVALVLGAIGGVPAGWFVALHFQADERWLVAGAMIGVGLLLVRRSLGMFGPPRARTQ